jgi:hypothetical protein
MSQKRVYNPRHLTDDEIKKYRIDLLGLPDEMLYEVERGGRNEPESTPSD